MKDIDVEKNQFSRIDVGKTRGSFWAATMGSGHEMGGIIIIHRLYESVSGLCPVVGEGLAASGGIIEYILPPPP